MNHKVGGSHETTRQSVLPKVDDNRLKHNYAAAYVSLLLSPYCLVRPVAEGTDIGVDLYCESVNEKGEPQHHFWVQVKGSKDFPDEDKKANYLFEAKHLEYWYRQPVPVFALLVPVASPPRAPQRVHVIELTIGLLNDPPTTQGRTLEADYSIKTNDSNALEDFLYNKVPYAAAARLISKGVIAPVEEATQFYAKQLPVGFTQKYCGAVLAQVRRTTCFAAIDLMCCAGDSSEPPDTWKTLVEVVRALKDDDHYEVPFTLACAALVNRETKEADEKLRQAEALVDKDSGLKEERERIKQWMQCQKGRLKPAGNTYGPIMPTRKPKSLDVPPPPATATGSRV